MVDAKRAFVSVTPPDDFESYSVDKVVHFVCSDMSETVLSIIGHFFDNVTDECSNYQWFGNQLVLLYLGVAS